MYKNVSLSGNENDISNKTLNSGGLLWGNQVSYLNKKINCFRIIFFHISKVPW